MSADFVQNERLAAIAKSAIALSSLAPHLAHLAQSVEAGARAQAERSTQMAEQTRQMTEDLEAAIKRLETSSVSVSQILDTIKRIANQTKVLSINAGIEAAKAGQYGSAFGVVATEVKTLSEKAMSATKDIGQSVESIQSDIQQTVSIAGLGGRSRGEVSATSTGFGLSQLGEQMREIARIANEQNASAEAVHEAGGNVRALCESLLLTVGQFRFSAHDKSSASFAPVLKNGALLSGDRVRQEAYLREVLKSNASFELFYLTDEKGIQVTGNIWADAQVDGSGSVGKDWSSRPWFTSVVNTKSVVISDIYRSSATDSYCFTISGPVMDGARLVGVLGADVNFTKMLA